MMHRWKPGDALRAAWLNEPIEAIRAARIRADGMASRKGRSRGGTQLGKAGPHPIWATVSGSANPYSFTEAFEDSAGAWSAGWRTGTCYEVNAVGSLNGTRQRLYPNRFGGWRFQSVKHSGPCSWTITVKGCNGVGYAGVSVTVVYSGGSASGTTDGSGLVTFTGLPTGSATATSTAPNARWVNTSVTRTLSAGSTTTLLLMNSASGYPWCAGCLDPEPTTLHYSFTRQDDDGTGSTPTTCVSNTQTGTLTFDGVSAWTGNYSDQVFYGYSTTQTITFDGTNVSVVSWSGTATATATPSCSPFSVSFSLTETRPCGTVTSSLTITE